MTRSLQIRNILFVDFKADEEENDLSEGSFEDDKEGTQDAKDKIKAMLEIRKLNQVIRKMLFGVQKRIGNTIIFGDKNPSKTFVRLI